MWLSQRESWLSGASELDASQAGPSPAELVQAGVADAEVVADLVDDRPAHPLHHVRLAVADRADRQAVDRDPIWQHARVVRCTSGQRDAAVEAEQAGRSGFVVDGDGHIPHQAAQLGGQPVERLADHLLESLAPDFDHQPIVLGGAGSVRSTSIPVIPVDLAGHSAGEDARGLDARARSPGRGRRRRADRHGRRSPDDTDARPVLRRLSTGGGVQRPGRERRDEAGRLGGAPAQRHRTHGSRAVAVRGVRHRDGHRDADPTGPPQIDVRPVPTVVVGAVGGLVVGMTSVGSGSLIIIALMGLYPKLRASELVGTDLVQAVPLVASAAVGHLIFGDFRLGVKSALPVGTIPGAYIGAQLSTRLPGALIRRALAFVLLASALKLLGVSTVLTGGLLIA